MDIFDLNSLSLTEALARISLAIAFGLILGWDRDSKNKPIDFRAYMIVCVTTCMMAMMALEMSYDLKDTQNLVSLDLGKIISGTLTGIGFLGAGAIIKRGNDQIIGTATGASIWAAGGIGLALGFGVYAIAIIGFVAIAATLIIGGFLMPKIQGETDKENID
jgi:putative Mg2+ transporter-C (MgtC) family protein